MSGSLRTDLFERALRLEEAADFCLSIGSSHSGLNVDRIPRSVGKRHMERAQGFGTTIVTIQKTPLDEFAAIRVYAKCDDFMMLVAARMGLAIDFETDYDYDTQQPKRFPPSANFHKYKTASAVAAPAQSARASSTPATVRANATVAQRTTVAAAAASSTPAKNASGPATTTPALPTRSKATTTAAAAATAAASRLPINPSEI